MFALAIEAPAPARWLSDFLEDNFQAWKPPSWGAHAQVDGADRIRLVLGEIDRALAALGDRTGEREDAARAWLDETRTKLTGPLEAFESLGTWGRGGHALNGPAARAMIENITAARATTAEAQRALHLAEGAEAVKAARENLDLAESEGRAVNRALAALIEAIRFPKLPELRLFEQARSHASINGTTSALGLLRALEQGRDAKREEAMLWICGEPKSSAPGSHYAWRWKAFVEAHP